MSEEYITKRRRGRRYRKLIIPAIILIVLAGGATAYYETTLKGYFPHKLRQQLDFKTYYPLNMPAGMSVDRSSFDIPTKKVLTFIVTDGQANKFYVSEEPSLNNFNFSKFKAKFESTDNIDTDNGSALVGDLGNQLIASINTTGNTWIIVNTAAIEQNGELETICRSLVQTK